MNLLVSNLQQSSGGLSLQVLSLSVENCLKPKYDYLVKELKGNVDMVTSFPAYFSLSLEQRIKPRHQFLVAMNRMPSGPFPMKCLAVTDACFCEQWAKSSLEEYYAFRNDLLLSNFAKKFESKNKVHIWQFTWCTSQLFFKLLFLLTICSSWNLVCYIVRFSYDKVMNNPKLNPSCQNYKQ